MLAEIVRQQLEKLQARDAARLQKEKEAKSKELLQTAEEQFTYTNFEESLDAFHQTYNINATPEDLEIAIKGMMDTSSRLYLQGNSEEWTLYKGNRNHNLTGEHWGTYTIFPSGEKKIFSSKSLIMHKGSQIIIASNHKLDFFAVGTIDGNKGEFTFHNLKTKEIGTGALEIDPEYSDIDLSWKNDGSEFVSTWNAINDGHTTTWLVDLSGDYVVEVKNASRRIFPKNTFNLKLEDSSQLLLSRTSISGDIKGASEDGLIQIKGNKWSFRSIEITFVSKKFNSEGVGKLSLAKDNRLLEGEWEVNGGTNGTWKMTRIE